MRLSADSKLRTWKKDRKPDLTMKKKSGEQEGGRGRSDEMEKKAEKRGGRGREGEHGKGDGKGREGKGKVLHN